MLESISGAPDVRDPANPFVTRKLCVGNHQRSTLRHAASASDRQIRTPGGRQLRYLRLVKAGVASVTATRRR
jgi:hypothetical protein